MKATDGQQDYNNSLSADTFVREKLKSQIKKDPEYILKNPQRYKDLYDGYKSHADICDKLINPLDAIEIDSFISSIKTLLDSFRKEGYEEESEPEESKPKPSSDRLKKYSKMDMVRALFYGAKLTLDNEKVNEDGSGETEITTKNIDDFFKKLKKIKNEDKD